MHFHLVPCLVIRSRIFRSSSSDHSSLLIFGLRQLMYLSLSCFQVRSWQANIYWENDEQIISKPNLGSQQDLLIFAHLQVPNAVQPQQEAFDSGYSTSSRFFQAYAVKFISKGYFWSQCDQATADPLQLSKPSSSFHSQQLEALAMIVRGRWQSLAERVIRQKVRAETQELQDLVSRWREQSDSIYLETRGKVQTQIRSWPSAFNLIIRKS